MNTISNNNGNNSKRSILLLEQLSKEIHLGIASFLDHENVVNYQTTCRRIKRAVNLHRLHKALARTNNTICDLDATTRDNEIHTHESFDGSLFYFHNLIHSVKLSFSYRDQGWGNRKGQVYIGEKKNQEFKRQDGKEENHQHQQRKKSCCWRDVDTMNNDLDLDDDLDELDSNGSRVRYLTSDENLGKIIRSSPLAEHHLTRCELVFRPKSGFSYDLCYIVGGGGGHSIVVTDIKLESFVHSSCIPLANILMEKSSSPSLSSSLSSSLFITNMLRYILDTVDYFSNEITQQQQHQVGSYPQPSVDFFQQSTGLDLLDEHDIEVVRMLLIELDRSE